jgi:hypothetical protein
MAVDKTMNPNDFEVIDNEVVMFGQDEPELYGEDELGLEEDPYIVELEDGGIEIDFGSGEDEEISLEDEPYETNLAELLSDDELSAIASDLIEKYEADKMSRQDWEKTYIEGLSMLGLKYEDRSEPWPGATGVYHPMLTEAVVRFQSQTIGEILPAKGPVKTSILGKFSEERSKQARRVQNYMNYVIMNEMTEYRRETDRLLWSLPLAGSAFRKVYPDTVLNRPAAKFVPAEDIVVNYAEASIETAERVTHRMQKSPGEIAKLQSSGLYRDIDLPEPSPERDAIRDKKDELEGTKGTTLEADPRHTILEFHTDYDIPGIEYTHPLPYIIILDKSSSEVLAIYRNWAKDDEKREKEQYFAHYEYVPGFGFYAFGLIHLIGSLAKGSTSILRQLIDAGTLANLPGGLKTRGMRVKGDDTPILPGEWRDVDVPSGVLRDNLMPLPYHEPSQTLFNLLGTIVQEGKQFASMADVKASDMNAEAPVGTTLAIMERALKIQTAIQQRIHEALKAEFKILARVIRDYTKPSYPYETDAGEDVKAEDFDDRVDIIPVSDPNASTFSQRIMQFQAVMQLASGAPQVYDLKILHRRMLETLGLPDFEMLIPMEEDIPPSDPVLENMNILNLKPVKAFEYQDHQAHIRVLMALKNDPMMAQQLQNSPQGGSVTASMDAHLREHMAFQYRAEIERELGAQLPPAGEPIPEDIEQKLSSMIADAADQALGTKQAMAQAEQNAALQQDPIIQQAQQEIDIKAGDLQRRQAADMAKQQIEVEKIQSRERIEGAKLQQQERESQLEAETERHYHETTNTLEGIKLGVEIATKAE